jgi:hypothetical protein
VHRSCISTSRAGRIGSDRNSCDLRQVTSKIRDIYFESAREILLRAWRHYVSVGLGRCRVSVFLVIIESSRVV